MQGTSPSAVALAGITFSVAGAGRVGTSLAGWAERCGAVLVRAVGREGMADLASAGQDLLLVAVPDRALAPVTATLARHRQAAVVLHTSGSQAGEVLAPLRREGSAVGSLHPLKAFPRPLTAVAEAAGVFFAVDGDPAAQALGRRLAAAWGGVAEEISPADRALYHFAATLAAGGAVTLLAAAAEIAAGLGLPSQVTAGYLELCRGAVEQAERVADPADALTGPAVRGDRATVERHLAALAEAAPDKLDLAVALLRETLHQLARRRPLDGEQAAIAAEIDPRAEAAPSRREGKNEDRRIL